MRISLEGEKERLKEILGNTDGFNWIVTCDGRAIGNIDISDVQETTDEFKVKAGSLNYFFGVKELWGKGITTAIVRQVLHWAFSKNGFEIIKSKVVPQNKGSVAALLKSSFEEYGREDYDGSDIGEPTWYNTYRLTKAKWLEHS